METNVRLDGYKNLLNKYGTTQDNSTAYYYQADSPSANFENTRWNKKELKKTNGGYSLTVEKPNSGSRCAFIELQFASPVNANSYYSQFSVPFVINQDK